MVILMNKRTQFFTLLVMIFLSNAIKVQGLSAYSQMDVRLKDIANIVEARENRLNGYGLVVGLRNTGDSKRAGFTEASLANMLGKLGVPLSGGMGSRNVASVMVSATLPPFIKAGQKIPVTVSAIGDSISLVGGQLLPTELKGPDLRTYALAQGPVIVGGVAEFSDTASYQRNQTTVGRIPDGGIVEVEVPVTFEDQHNITIVLNNRNFITVSRAAKAIQENGFPGARAIDANTIKIPLADLQSADLVDTIAKLQDISLIPDASSKIVINSRTGTVVIGEMVRLFPTALTHGNIAIRISNQGAVAGIGNQGQQAEAPLQIEEPQNQLVLLNPSATLTGLVNALNEIGATPKDLISIIQALQESGALVGEIVLL
jgi:flagellar P-ring protein precursor FlgI